MTGAKAAEARNIPGYFATRLAKPDNLSGPVIPPDLIATPDPRRNKPMKPMPISTRALAACLALTTLAIAAPAQAERQEDREARREARQDAGPVSRSSEATTRRGEFSRRMEADIDTEGERAYRSRTLEGPDGESVGVLGEIQRTEDGTVTSQTFTDRDGETAGRSFSRSAEEGRYTREREAYTRSGETASASDTIERTDDGASRVREFETSTGRGGAVESDIARTEDGATFSRTATDADGDTRATRETTVTHDEDGASKTTTVTDAEGEE